MSDQFRRPLKRRTAAERLRLLRPTALQVASAFTACLLSASALWLVLAPWPEPPSPIIRMAMTGSDPLLFTLAQGLYLSRYLQADDDARTERQPAGEP